MFRQNTKITLDEHFLEKYYSKMLIDFMTREGVSKYDIHKKTGLHYDTITAILGCTGYNIRSLEKIIVEYQLVDMV